MAYFPEYYGGEYYNRALTSVGNELGASIAESIKFYRQRHDELEQMDNTLKGLSQMSDINGKPILDPKALDRVLAHNDKERYGIEKGLIQALDMGTQLQKSHADINKAIMSDRSAGGGSMYQYDAQGRPYAQWNAKTGTWVKMPQPPSSSTDGSQKDLTSRANKGLSNLGYDADEFKQRTDEETGTVPVDPSGNVDSTKLNQFRSGSESQKQKIDAGPQNAVRFKTPDGKTHVVPKSDFDVWTKVHPRQGDPGYEKQVQVGKPQGNTINYPIGTRARRGNTWYIMTDQGWVPDKSQGTNADNQ